MIAVYDFSLEIQTLNFPFNLLFIGIWISFDKIFKSFKLNKINSLLVRNYF